MAEATEALAAGAEEAGDLWVEVCAADQCSVVREEPGPEPQAADRARWTPWARDRGLEFRPTQARERGRWWR